MLGAHKTCLKTLQDFRSFQLRVFLLSCFYLMSDLLILYISIFTYLFFLFFLSLFSFFFFYSLLFYLFSFFVFFFLFHFSLFIFFIYLFFVIVICYFDLSQNFYCHGVSIFFLDQFSCTSLLGFVYLDLSTWISLGSKCLLYYV